MKRINNLLMGLLVCAFMSTTTAIAQEETAKEELKPIYISVTTLHWSDDSEADFSD